MSNNLDKYTEGLEMEQFERIPEKSTYNDNIYKGFDGDLLHGISDDDDTTEWWVIRGNNKLYLGESRSSRGELLNRYKNQQA